MSTLLGIEVVESLHAKTEVEDWSDCRSPSRARRRLRQGHRQNVVRVTKPCVVFFAGRFYAHPVALRDFSLSGQLDASTVWR